MQRYFSDKKDNNQLVLSDNDLYHIKTVMRMKDNDLIEVVYNEQLYLCYLDNYKAIIKDEIKKESFHKQEIILCISLVKEQKMDLILQKATELGVDKIIPLITKNSIIKIDNEEKKLNRWSRICKEASEQSKRLTIPTITNIKRLNELNYDGLKIICSTTEKNNTINKVLKNRSKYDKIVFVIGPEGGLDKKEEELLVLMGYIKTTLGNLIMRVETVPLYLLSILNYEMME